MKSVKLNVKPQTQWEGHTCGLCAASAVYEYYGMDPEQLEIRRYLGTDHALPPCFPARESLEKWINGDTGRMTGTLPPDMLAVLYWDGFDTETIASPYHRHRDRLHDHLANGDPALAMLYSCWHWVVVTGMDDRGVWIADGILWDDPGRKRRRYRLSHESYAVEEHGLILVSREDEEGERRIREMTNADFAREYARGVAFSAGMLGRNIPRWLMLDRFLLKSGLEID